MPDPAYPAARAVAERVHEHFAKHRSHVRAEEQSSLAPLPDLETIERVIDAAFWTSLRREEQYPPRISLAFVPPEQAAPALLFEQPLLLNPGKLTKIAPGVERPGIHLGISSVNGELRIWGATRMLPMLCFVVETVAPGLIVVKHRRGEAAKFVNVAVLEGDQVKILDHRLSGAPGCPGILATLLGLDAQNPASSDSSSVMIRLAVSMREHGRGGSLLIVPARSETWRESVSQPLSYSVLPPYAELSEILRENPDERNKRRWREALNRAVDAVAGLTAVDGATVISSESELLAFGAKIIRRKGSVAVERITMSEPIEGAEAQSVHPGQLGGTRHLSAAQFCYDQRDAVALVASQDGPFTVFSWSDCDDLLVGYRVETLLL